MKWSNVFKLLLLFSKVFNRLFLCLLLCLVLVTFAFDRLVAAEVPRAFPKRAPIADAQLRRGILEAFPFRPLHARPVFDVFEQEHPGLEAHLGRTASWVLVGWCVYLHETSRLDATMNGTAFFDRDGECLDGLDAACRHWFNHGIESATADELKKLKQQVFSRTHPAWRSYWEKHPGSFDGV